MLKIIALIVAALLIAPSKGEGAVKIVTSTSDLAYFARVIGADKVDVTSIASPTADLHYVEVRPSYMVKMKDAQLVLKVGLELDSWIERIIDGSRNAKLKKVDCSKYIAPLEIPAFKADASYGDLHRYGNPHYWLSPENIEPITRAILEGLATVDPANEQLYRDNRDRFLAEIDSELPAMKALAAPLVGIEMITYHNSWPYFAHYFGIELPGFVEKYAGVAPSPSHMGEIIDLVKKDQIKIIAMEPYFEKRVPQRIAEATGAKLITLYPSIGGRRADESYLDLLRGNIDALLEAAR
ncbi:MAG: metal ABC transporter substrate-binding protein [Candidatus Zixiibacteriota bacterium]